MNEQTVQSQHIKPNLTYLISLKMTTSIRSTTSPEWDFRDVVQYTNLYRCVATVGGEQCRNSVGRDKEDKARRIIKESGKPQQQRSRSLARYTLCHVHSHSMGQEAVDYWCRVLQSDASIMAKALSSDCPTFWNSFKRLQAQKAGLIAEESRLIREVKERSRQEAEKQEIRTRCEDTDRRTQLLQWKDDEICHQRKQDQWEKERVEHEERRWRWGKEGLDYEEEQRQRERERTEHEERRRQWKKEGLDYEKEQRQREEELRDHKKMCDQWKKKHHDHKKMCDQWERKHHHWISMRRQWDKERRFHAKRLSQWENKRRHHKEHPRQELAKCRHLEHEPLLKQKMEHSITAPGEADHERIRHQAPCQHENENRYTETRAGVALQSEQDGRICIGTIQLGRTEETQAGDTTSQASMHAWRRFTQVWDVLGSLSADFNGQDSSVLRPWPNKASMRLLHSKANTEDGLKNIIRTPFQDRHDLGTSMRRLSPDGCDGRGLWKVAHFGQSVKKQIREMAGAGHATG
jgi:hypothetical protein